MCYMLYSIARDATDICGIIINLKATLNASLGEMIISKRQWSQQTLG
jgi:hypothetical protein